MGPPQWVRGAECYNSAVGYCAHSWEQGRWKSLFRIHAIVGEAVFQMRRSIFHKEMSQMPDKTMNVNYTSNSKL